MPAEPRRLQILLIGDVSGPAGRQALGRRLPELRLSLDVDLVVANVENMADGRGVTPELAEELKRLGVDVMTSGNHIWDRREILPYIARPDARLLRPYNMTPESPGTGLCVVQTRSGTPVAVLNIMGRLFMHPLVACPFRAADEALAAVPRDVKVVVVDMHAEATSEKQAMAWHLAGRASCVVGTHTHVQTADARILPPGTATITDLGLTGAHDGVIGMNKDQSVERFRMQLPRRLDPATGDPRLQGALVSVDPTTGRAVSIERVDVGLA